MTQRTREDTKAFVREAFDTLFECPHGLFCRCNRREGNTEQTPMETVDERIACQNS